MKHFQRIAFLFPGQGAQYCGMGKDFCDAFSIARETFEEGNDILQRDLTSIIFEGPEDKLTETRNSQAGIYLMSMALLRVLQQQFPALAPFACAGLSLGEYTAATAAGRITFADCLPLVQDRGQFMNDACETTEGTMAAVIGLDGAEVQKALDELNRSEEVWTANFNCPKQVVISGTFNGIQAASEKLKECGAKRILPLQVHGAFHSGLMREAERRLAERVNCVPLAKSDIGLVMNVTGDFVNDLAQMRQLLIQQVTRPVQWESGIRSMMREGIDLFIEIGPGKTLAGMNKRIGVPAPTMSIERIGDLDLLQQELNQTTV